MRQLLLEIAGIKIQIEHEEELLQKLASKYSTTETKKVDFEIKVHSKEIDIKEVETKGEFTRGQIDSILVSNKVAEKLPFFSCVLFHGAVITFDDKGFLFTAPSGTGKTTHIRMWKRYLKDHVDIVNGDKPVLKFENDIVTAYGTPWAGKENWQKNRSAVLSGICILSQSKQNRIQRLNNKDILEHFIRQIFLPKDPKALICTLEMLDKLITNVPVYLLECDISEEAVKTSFETMTDLSYNDFRQV